MTQANVIQFPSATRKETLGERLARLAVTEGVELEPRDLVAALYYKDNIDAGEAYSNADRFLRVIGDAGFCIVPIMPLASA